MRLFCLACEALARLIYKAATDSPHIVDIKLVSLGKHTDPKQLNNLIQSEIDQLEGSDYDAIIIGYGLCGNWLNVLNAHSIPVVLPKTHDCIPLILGDVDLYKKKMEETPGTYWYTRDFIERANPGDSFIPLGASTPKVFGCTLDELIQKYGEENATYLSQIAGEWQNNYQRAIWVEPNIDHLTEQEKQAEREAKNRNWQFEKIKENAVFISSLLDGEWLTRDDGRFFVVPPHQSVALSYDDNMYKLIPGIESRP